MSIINVASSSRVRRLALLACFFPIAACTASVDDGATGQASEQALAPVNYAFGFAWVNPPTPVDPTYSYTSGGGAITYTGSAGVYTVTMPQLGLGGGNVQVVSYGSAATRCKVASWGPSGSSLFINVRCHDVHGAPAASPFVAFYSRGASPSQTGAHLWFDGASVSPTYSWNSAGGTNSVARTSLGHYTATLPALGFSNASAHVTAYGTDARHCKLVSWGLSGSNANVNVRCNDTAGAPADSAFSLNYTSTTPRSFMTGGHAWVDGPTSANASYQKNSDIVSCWTAGPVTVSGFRDVTYPDTHNPSETWPSMALATAYGDDGNFCKVSGWAQVGTGFVVHNACFTPSGAATTARFTSSFMLNVTPGPC